VNMVKCQGYVHRVAKFGVWTPLYHYGFPPGSPVSSTIKIQTACTSLYVSRGPLGRLAMLKVLLFINKVDCYYADDSENDNKVFYDATHIVLIQKITLKFKHI
jgi:hypothetical protein